MAVNEIYQVTIRQLLHEQTVLNVVHYRQTTAPTMGTDEASLIGGVEANVIPAMKAFQSVELTHVSVTAQKIHPVPPLVAITSTTAAGPGGLAGGSLPTSMAAVLTKRTAFAGRKFRGRIFIAGVAAGNEDDSKLSAGAFIAFNDVGNAFEVFPGTNGGVFEPILWHRATKTFTNLAQVEPRLILRNQRRRQVGRGE